MKRFFVLAGIILASAMVYAQPKLSENTVDEVLKAMTLEEKAMLCVGGGRAVNLEGIPTGITDLVLGAAGCTRGIERLGIPSTILADGPAGLRIDPVRPGDPDTYYCTAFPIGTLLASTWDISLVESMSAALGNEVREYGVDVLLAPGQNIHRNPLCGRNFEYFSEDPLLSGKMAAAYVRGVQSNGVGTSIKHFALNNQETNRRENDAQVSRRALREIYFKNFEITVKEGRPWTVMSSYNKILGTYVQQSHDVLTGLLRDEWGFDGIVMTDWGNKDNTVAAVNAGNDLMQPGDQTEVDRILDGVRNGNISIADLDRNVRRILEYIARTPSFKGQGFSNKPDLKAHASLARAAAGEGIVLLKNDDNTLPVKADGQRIALYGETSIDFVAGGTGSGTVNKAYNVNMKEALESAGYVVDKRISGYYEKYVEYNDALLALAGTARTNRYGISKFTDPEIARSSIELHEKDNDIAVVVLGRVSGESYDRHIDDDFNLSAIERQLLSDVYTVYHSHGKKVIAVLNVGGVIETASWKNMADAIVLPWLAGQEGANAVADVISGKVNPSGKLPMTFPLSILDHPSSRNFPFMGETSGKNYDSTAYEEGIWVGYRYFNTFCEEVSYPFGYGLSYTTFKYCEPEVKMTKDGFTARVTVTNTGSVAGKEAVQLYVTAPSGGMEKPRCELKSFAKTKLLEPGESQTLEFTVDSYSLASFNEGSGRWESASGTYSVHFAANVEDIRCSVPFKLPKMKTWEVAVF